MILEDESKPSGSPHFDPEEFKQPDKIPENPDLDERDLFSSVGDVEAPLDKPWITEAGETIVPNYSTRRKMDNCLKKAGKGFGGGGLILWSGAAEANALGIATIGMLSTFAGAALYGSRMLDPEDKLAGLGESVQSLGDRQVETTTLSEAKKYLEDNYDEEQNFGVKHFDGLPTYSFEPSYSDLEVYNSDIEETSEIVEHLEEMDKFRSNFENVNVLKKEYGEEWVHITVKGEYSSDITPDKNYGREFIEENFEGEEAKMLKEYLPEPRETASDGYVEMSILGKHPNKEAPRPEDVEEQYKEGSEDDFRDWRTQSDTEEISREIGNS